MRHDPPPHWTVSVAPGMTSVPDYDVLLYCIFVTEYSVGNKGGTPRIILLTLVTSDTVTWCHQHTPPNNTSRGS